MPSPDAEYPSDAGKLSAVFLGKVWAFQGAVTLWASVQLGQLSLPASRPDGVGTIGYVEAAASELVDVIWMYLAALRARGMSLPEPVSADD